MFNDFMGIPQGQSKVKSVIECCIILGDEMDAP
jgi:hypothetical protein